MQSTLMLDGCPGNCLGECRGEMSRENVLEPSGTPQYSVYKANASVDTSLLNCIKFLTF